MTTPHRSLTERAIIHARHRRSLAAVGANYRHEDLPQWQRRARSVNKIAERLAVRVCDVEVIDDPHRTYGVRHPQPGDLITITDPNTAEVLRFLPDLVAFDRRWLLIDDCPECGGLVPMACVESLADVGDYLDTEDDAPAGTLPARHQDDPGHHATCSRRTREELNDLAHR